MISAESEGKGQLFKKTIIDCSLSRKQQTYTLTFRQAYYNQLKENFLKKKKKKTKTLPVRFVHVFLLPPNFLI